MTTTVDKFLVGQRIKKIRINAGLSMEALGKKLSTSKGAVNNWEKGKNLPNVTRLKKIAELGNISLDELIYGDLKEAIIALMFKYERYTNVYELTKNDFIAQGKDLEEQRYLECIYDYANFRRHSSSVIPIPKEMYIDKEKRTEEQNEIAEQYYRENDSALNKKIFYSALDIAQRSNIKPSEKEKLARILSEVAENLFYSYTPDNQGLLNLVRDKLEELNQEIDSFIYISYVNDNDVHTNRNNAIDIELEEKIKKIIDDAEREISDIDFYNFLMNETDD
ncbi:MAG: helix-turn-helix transcriptional regulator [Enterococcus faecalis]|nr:helix-turn-helix transcriptional regulator [Enterococcus faecalis]